MIAAPAREDDPAVRLSPGEVVRAGELQCRLHRLRAAADRVDRGIVDRQLRPQLPRVALQRLVGEGTAVRVGEPRRLVGHDGGDVTSSVAHVHDHRTAGRVEVGPTLGIGDGGPPRGDGDQRLGARRTPEDPARGAFVGTHGAGCYRSATSRVGPGAS